MLALVQLVAERRLGDITASIRIVDRPVVAVAFLAAPRASSAGTTRFRYLDAIMDWG